MKKNNFKILIFYLVLIVGIFAALTLMFRQGSAEEAIQYGDVLNYFEKDAVAEFVVDDSYYLTMKVYVLDENGEHPVDEAGKLLEDATTKTIGFQLPSYVDFVGQFTEYYKDNENLNLANCDVQPEATTPMWVAFLPYIIVIVVIVILYFVIAKQAADRKSTRLNSSHKSLSRMPSSA